MAGLALMLVGVLAGCVIAIQGPINGALARSIGSPITAALISFAAGLVLLGTAFVAFVGPAGFLAGWRTVPAWTLAAGGVLGAIYITGAAFAIPRIGAATFLVLAVAGQIGMGLVLDHLGAFGLAPHALGPGRVAAALLIVAGVVLTRLT